MSKENKPKKGENIHDNYFKHTFGHPETVADFLQANLSKKLLAQISLSTLHKKDKEFLPTKYRNSRQADLLYAVKKKDGNHLFLLLHLEAQGKPDKLMAVRVLEYHTAIIRGYLEEGATNTPTIISFVLYHGKKDWQGAKSIADLFADFDLYLHESLQKSFLVNLPAKNLEELKKHGLASAPEIVLAKQPSKDIAPIFEDLIPMLEEQKKCCKDLTIKYVFKVDKRKDVVLIEELSKFDQETAENYKIMFERSMKKYQERGRQEGMTLGRQEGEMHGLKKGRQNTLKDLLAKGVLTKSQVENFLKEK